METLIKHCKHFDPISGKRKESCKQKCDEQSRCRKDNTVCSHQIDLCYNRDDMYWCRYYEE